MTVSNIIVGVGDLVGTGQLEGDARFMSALYPFPKVTNRFIIVAVGSGGSNAIDMNVDVVVNDVNYHRLWVLSFLQLSICGVRV